MNRKLTQLFRPSFRLYFVCMILFAALSSYYSPILCIAELVLTACLAIYSQNSDRRRQREIDKYLEHVTGSMDVAAKDTMSNAPVPMVIFRPESDEVIWTNDRFLKLTGEGEHLYDTKLAALVPDFDARWLMEGKSECPREVHFAQRRFLVFGHLVRTGGRTGGFLATTYWIDVTEFSITREKYIATRPIVGILLLDNYEDLVTGLAENARSAILSEIDARLDAWVAPTGGILRRYQRERYLLIFDEQYLPEFIEKKFEVLDAIHQIVNPSGINASLSIGLGKDGESYWELLQFANLSIDMALSRGGDQAVIRNSFTFEFYGGRTKETEKRTKVKSRVMANALSALIADSSQVFIMGHKSPDNDCVGAAAGIVALCRKSGVAAHIVGDGQPSPAQELLERLTQLPEYHDCLISAQDAMVLADARALAVVVDTNRPEQVQDEALLASCNRVAVIDHHRRAATYIDGASLNYHEPYASSASELVTELLQYVVEPSHILRIEAEALLAGIVLDTKNFTIRTGARTFEAAAFLRRLGADTAEVKKLFQNDLCGTIAKYAIIQNARIYREKIAIATAHEGVGRVTAAQAADELLNISGIDTSFVLAQDGERVVMCARSMGEVNVQVILEQLGGGGNAAAAGGQVTGKTLEDVETELKHAIDSYFEK